MRLGTFQTLIPSTCTGRENTQRNRSKKQDPFNNTFPDRYTTSVFSNPSGQRQCKIAINQTPSSNVTKTKWRYSGTSSMFPNLSIDALLCQINASITSEIKVLQTDFKLQHQYNSSIIKCLDFHRIIFEDLVEYYFISNQHNQIHSSYCINNIFWQRIKLSSYYLLLISLSSPVFSMLFCFTFLDKIIYGFFKENWQLFQLLFFIVSHFIKHFYIAKGITFSMTLVIRKFKNEDFQTIRDWRVNLKWNPGIFDHFAFKKIDRQGFFIAQLDGQIIGSIGAVQYDSNFAAVGMYMILEKHRNKGFGIKLWNKALERITAKTVGLYGAMQHELKFNKSNFITSFKAIRFGLNGTGVKYQNQYLRDCRQVKFEDLVEYDRGVFPVERKMFLQQWINLPKCRPLAFVKQNKIHGYGVLRLSGSGYKLGPFYADTYEIAAEILQHLIGEVSTQDEIVMDIPEINSHGIRLAKEFNMHIVFDCLRMFKNDSAIDIHADQKVYGITCLEFG